MADARRQHETALAVAAEGHDKQLAAQQAAHATALQTAKQVGAEEEEAAVALLWDEWDEAEELQQKEQQQLKQRLQQQLAGMRAELAAEAHELAEARALLAEERRRHDGRVVAEANTLRAVVVAAEHATQVVVRLRAVFVRARSSLLRQAWGSMLQLVRASNAAATLTVLCGASSGPGYVQRVSDEGALS